MLVVTGLYAGILAIILIALSVNVIRNRVRAKAVIGTTEDQGLLYAIRAQANFVEYVPFMLILMAIAELNAASVYIVHVMGIVAVVGRIAHAVSLNIIEQGENGHIKLRQLGMFCTFFPLAMGAITVLFRI